VPKTCMTPWRRERLSLGRRIPPQSSHIAIGVGPTDLLINEVRSQLGQTSGAPDTTRDRRFRVDSFSWRRPVSLRTRRSSRFSYQAAPQPAH
jgi:hypothetical protein